MYGEWTRNSDNEAELVLGPGNGVVKMINNGPGSLELRYSMLNNNAPRAHWRILFNATGGVEIQNASDDTYTDAKNVLSLAGGDVNVNIDNYGTNMDSQRLDKFSRVSFRNSDGSQVLGQVASGPSPLNANQSALYLSSVNLAGNLQPYIIIDPRDSTQIDAGDNPICLWVGGQWHRVRRVLLNGQYVATLG